METDKLTEKQKQIVNQLSHEMRSWMNSNDITSPTLATDIHEVLLRFGVSGGGRVTTIRKHMMKILKEVRKIK